MASLNIPPSNNTVRVRAIDLKTLMCPYSRRFIEPQIPGFDILNLTSICFLIDNPKLNKRILFDCGARKDVENYSPTTKKRLNALFKGFKIDHDVNDVLVDAGIPLESIDSMVWSHWHWDHIGAAEKFPTTVEIVVGPGFKENFMPGYPTNPEAACLDANFANREVREISFSESPFKIGKFPAYDFFGDGSFYLLDSPGHAIGHMCGLARTTPTTFMLLGGDICHFSGMFRPSSGVPLPDNIPSDQLDDGFPSPCPCSMFTDQHPIAPKGSEEAKSTKFFNVTSIQPSSYHERETAMKSLDALQEFDGSPDVLVCIAHDPTLIKVLPFMNGNAEQDMNDWQAKGLKEKMLWGWLNDLPRNGKPGRPLLTDGLWWKGQRITDFLELQPSQ